MDRIRLILFCLCVACAANACGASKEIARLSTLPPEPPPPLSQFELLQMRLGLFGSTPEQCGEYLWWSCKRCLGMKDPRRLPP